VDCSNLRAGVAQQRPDRARSLSQRMQQKIVELVATSSTLSVSVIAPLEHDPEKCEAVFRKDHAQTII
jgi:uncharacterized membrane protein